MSPESSEQDPFPETLWTLILAASAGGAEDSDSSHQLGELAARYRSAILQWLEQRRIPRPDAEDLTQQFLQRMMAGEVLKSFTRTTTRFRVFLCTCLRNHLRDHLRRQDALKRGGEAEILAWDDSISPEIAGDAQSLDEPFARAAAVSALTALSQDWCAKGWGERFAELRPHIFGAPEAGDYAASATRLNLKPNHVRQLVFTLREEFFTCFRREVSATVTADELNEELRHLIAILGRCDLESLQPS